MLRTILDWLGGGVLRQFTAPLLDAYKARLDANNDSERLAAETTIGKIEAARDIALAEQGRAWSATSVGRWLIVVPWSLWWAAIFAVSIINPLFGTTFTIHAVPPDIREMALVLVPAIVVADAGMFAVRRLGK
jgi:hypothetical protein